MASDSDDDLRVALCFGSLKLPPVSRAAAAGASLLSACRRLVYTSFCSAALEAAVGKEYRVAVELTTSNGGFVCCDDQQLRCTLQFASSRPQIVDKEGTDDSEVVGEVIVLSSNRTPCKVYHHNELADLTSRAVRVLVEVTDDTSSSSRHALRCSSTALRASASLADMKRIICDMLSMQPSRPAIEGADVESMEMAWCARGASGRDRRRPPSFNGLDDDVGRCDILPMDSDACVMAFLNDLRTLGPSAVTLQCSVRHHTPL